MVCFFDYVVDIYCSWVVGFWELLSVFWISVCDVWFFGGAWFGLLGVLLVLVGFVNVLLLVLLWVLYLLFIYVG